MKKLTKRAASLLVAAAMCVPAVTSAAAAEGVDYDDYYCARLELNDLEIPAYGNGEYTFNDYGFVYQYDRDTLLSRHASIHDKRLCHMGAVFGREGTYGNL